MRIIAITGATGGLAKEIVKQLPSDDFVIALGRNVKKLEACYVERPNTVCYELDMSSDEAIGAMLNMVTSMSLSITLVMVILVSLMLIQPLKFVTCLISTPLRR